MVNVLWLESKENINILQESIIKELQRIAPDKIFIVWEQKIKELNDSDSNIKYEIDYDYKQWIWACFPNQWEEIEKYLKSSNLTLLNQIENNLTIIDLDLVREWKNDLIFWKKIEENFDLQLISWWSMNLLTSSKKNKHIVLTTRDWWNVDKWWLTWVAGRCESPNIDEESLKEFIEEWSYLWYIDWELNIIIPSILGWLEEIKKFVDRFIDSIRKNALINWRSTIWFLSEKYKPEDKRLEKLFNKNFNDKDWDLDYLNLWKKLEEALSKWNILFYDIEEDKSKYNSRVNIWDKTYEWYIYNDKDNKTTEYRKVYNIDLSKVKNLQWKKNKTPKYIWRLDRPSTMFLESENQETRTINLNHNHISSSIYSRLVPATKEFVKEIINNNK